MSTPHHSGFGPGQQPDQSQQASGQSSWQSQAGQQFPPEQQAQPWQQIQAQPSPSMPTQQPGRPPAPAQPAPYGNPMQQGWYPQQPQYGATAPSLATGTLRVTIQGSFWTNSMASPTVTIDGAPLRGVGTSGSVDVPLVAGVHHLHVHSNWMRQYGKADLAVNVPPGGMIEVFYNAPMHQFAGSGNIGFTPQPKSGQLVFWLMMAIVLVPCVLWLLVNLFGG